MEQGIEDLEPDESSAQKQPASVDPTKTVNLSRFPITAGALLFCTFGIGLALWTLNLNRSVGQTVDIAFFAALLIIASPVILIGTIAIAVTADLYLFRPRAAGIKVPLNLYWIFILLAPLTFFWWRYAGHLMYVRLPEYGYPLLKELDRMNAELNQHR
jgi:hypothetical protein